MDVQIVDVQNEVEIEETIEVIEVEDVEQQLVRLSEAFPPVGDGNTNNNHALLNNRELDNQHPITAIEGLRKELDTIEALQTVYSDKFGVANYYKWNGASYGTAGYFVSIVPDTDTIQICGANDPVFGVIVDAAAFIGGQDGKTLAYVNGETETAGVARDNAYGLVMTSGLVDVYCELDVKVGDYVVPNVQGYAKKSDAKYGYKVLAKETKFGAEYAVISLDIQADVISAIGAELIDIDSRMDAAEKNIVSAVNVANQAHNKANESGEVSEEALQRALEAVQKSDSAINTTNRLSNEVSNVGQTAAKAKAIAESAATSAESMRNEAIESANNTAAQIKDITKTIEPITTWVDPNTGNSGASYLVNYIDNGLATKAEIETVEDDLEHATSAIQQNAKSIQSLVVSIDKYSVGEYSTAHGLTLDQATSILEDGIIYAPTVSHKETYSYVDGETTYEYEREFTPGYLYQWGTLANGRYGWITIDKHYNEIANINTSAPSVHFSAHEIAISASDDYGYWYTNADTIYDIDGNVTEEYEPYTLYKWDDGRWIAVATLAGNVNNRSISQIRQTANEVALEVTNARGSAATLGARITDTESEVQSLATWTKDEDGNQYNLASIKQTADEAGADIALVVQEKDGEKVVNSASIVAAINDDESSVGINADRITMTGTTTFLQPEDVGDNGSTVISGSRITTGELDAEKVKVINLQASNIIVTGSGDNKQTVDEALANTLVSSTIYYALSTSTKTPPADDAWSEVAPAKERKKYMWQKTVNVYGDGSSEEKMVCIAGADGEGAIVVDIKSSTGTIYVNSDIQTTLIAKAYQDNQDITDEFPDGAFLWEKYDMYGVKDSVWSYTGKTVSVSNLDIYKRAMFNCVLDVEQRL